MGLKYPRLHAMLVRAGMTPVGASKAIEEYRAGWPHARFWLRFFFQMRHGYWRG